jgi:hypothetical protein
MSDMYSQLVNGLLADVLQYSVPTAGTTVIVAPSTTLLLIDAGGLLANLTVTLPATPTDGQRLVIASSGIITVLTINGGTVKGLLTSLSVNGYARFAYSMQAGAWFRTG